MNMSMQKLAAFLAAAVFLGGLLVSQHAAASQTSAESLVPDQGSTGSPPLIPHEIDQSKGNEVCQECHRLGEEGAPKYPSWHATLVDCQQCHVAESASTATFQTDY